MPALKSGFVSVCLLLALLCTGAHAETKPEPEPSTTTIEDLTVIAPGLPWGDGSVPESILRENRDRSLAEALENLPGISAVRQAPSAAEPVIRGMGWERVQTVFGAVPLYGACPGRMDPPATYLGNMSTNGVAVYRTGGTLGYGPGGTGGSIFANPDYQRSKGAPSGLKIFLDAGYESARDGYYTEAGFFGGTAKVDVKLGFGFQEKNDYTAPDGTVVPAHLQRQAANVSLGFRLGENSRLWNALTQVSEEDVDFPSLPMDNLSTDFLVYNIGWSQEFHGDTMKRLDVTGGFSTVDHFMGNAYKVTSAALDATTDSDVRTQAGHAHLELTPGQDLTLNTGFDFNRVNRDATRRRQILASGATFYDRLWPDAVQTTYGVFARLKWPLASSTKLYLNGRFDLSYSEARAADAASLGGRTVREQYVRFYGEEAADTDLTESLGAFSANLEREFTPDALWYLRAGLSTRAAGITERYYAFGPAPGGFQVGNPTLDPEKKLEAETGLQFSSGKLTTLLNVFYASVWDFILATPIHEGDINGDDTIDLVKGFYNVDASLFGGELGLEYRPLNRFYLPVTVSYVRGRNTTDDRDLPEIPALSSTVEARYLAHQGSQTWLSFGAFFAADQDKIDPLFPEDRTPGYAVYHLSVESQPAKGLFLRVGVENLFDRLYHDHLTHNALLPSEGLAAGQEIPAPGRDWRLSARWEF